MKHEWEQIDVEEKLSLCDVRIIYLECRKCSYKLAVFESEIGLLDQIEFHCKVPNCSERLTERILSA